MKKKTKLFRHPKTQFGYHIECIRASPNGWRNLYDITLLLPGTTNEPKIAVGMGWTLAIGSRKGIWSKKKSRFSGWVCSELQCGSPSIWFFLKYYVGVSLAHLLAGISLACDAETATVYGSFARRLLLDQRSRRIEALDVPPPNRVISTRVAERLQINPYQLVCRRANPVILLKTIRWV